MNPLPGDLPPRVHISYSEPADGWTRPPLHLGSVAEAEQHIAGMMRLAGPDSARRRKWSISSCDCETPDVHA